MIRKILSSLFFIFWAFNFLFSQSPEWVNFTANKNILSLTVEGNYIWVGTKGGLVRLNMLTGEKVNYNSANSGLPDNYVHAIAIGHVTINFNGPKCNCGNYGCAEAYVGQKYLSSWVAEELKANSNSKIIELISGDLSKIEPYIISLAAEQGDEFAINVWKKTGFYVGVMLASVMNLFDITVAIIGGGVAKAGKILFDSINETVKSRALKPIAEKAIVIPAMLGNKAGILGAGALAFEELTYTSV